MTEILTDDRVERARRDGFVFPVPVLSREKARHYLDRFEDYEREYAGRGPRKLMVKPHVLFPWMVELGTTPSLLDSIERLIGPDILLTSSAIWVKNGNDPSYTTWHQDSAYFGYEPLEVWGALDRAHRFLRQARLPPLQAGLASQGRDGTIPRPGPRTICWPAAR